MKHYLPLINTVILLGIFLALIGLLSNTSSHSKPKTGESEHSPAGTGNPKPVAPEPSPTGADKKNWDDICDRSIIMQNELLSWFNVKLCRAIAVRELYRIQFLDIEVFDDEHLRAGDFVGMSNLVSLDLDGQNHEEWRLPEGLFQHLESLERLTISSHVYTSVLDQVTELPNLIELNLGLGDPYYPRPIQIRFTPAGACVRSDGLQRLEEAERGGQVLRDYETAFGPLAECK